MCLLNNIFQRDKNVQCVYIFLSSLFLLMFPVMFQCAPLLRIANTPFCQQLSAVIGHLAYKCNIHLKVFFPLGCERASCTELQFFCSVGRVSHNNRSSKIHKFVCDAKLTGSLRICLHQPFLMFGPYRKNARLAKIAAISPSEVTLKHLLEGLLYYSLNSDKDFIFVFICVDWQKRPSSLQRWFFGSFAGVGCQAGNVTERAWIAACYLVFQLILGKCFAKRKFKVTTIPSRWLNASYLTDCRIALSCCFCIILGRRGGGIRGVLLRLYFADAILAASLCLMKEMFPKTAGLLPKT